MPELVIIWGGSEMYGAGENWLATEPCVDYILIGEGKLPCLPFNGFGRRHKFSGSAKFGLA